MKPRLLQGSGLSYWLFVAGSAILFFGIRVSLIAEHGSQTPYWDDWGMGAFLTNTLSEPLTLEALFADANEHRLVFNKLFSLALFNANQHQWDPLVSMVLNALIWAGTGMFLIALTIRHYHEVHSPLLIAIIIILFCFPIGMANILWGIQTHTYTMILFSVLGCWHICHSPFTLKWYFGFFCLAAAGLTLAGGTFAAFAVLAVQLYRLIVTPDQYKKLIPTITACILAGGFGLCLILVQPGSTTAPSSLTLVDAITTFMKTMSWPNSNLYWPALITIAPFIALLWQSFRNRRPMSKLQQFTIAVFVFTLIVAAAIAFARGAGGNGPMRRYYDFLALIPIASLLCILLINRPNSSVGKQVFGIFFAGWLCVFSFSFVWQAKVFSYSLEDKIGLQPIQGNLVKEFLNTGDDHVFENKPFRHVPFTQPDRLKIMLRDMSEKDTLPYSLQTPKPIEWHPKYTLEQQRDSAFVENGTIRPSTKETKVNRTGEDVFGSYNPRLGGMEATGEFESQDFRLSRPYTAIPVTGYFGYEGLSLTLIDVGSGEKFEISPEEVSSKYAEYWREIVLPIPRGYYRVVAKDDNEDLWFGFATPRSVGRVSYYTKQLLDHCQYIWIGGLLLILLSLRSTFASILRPGTSRSTE